jgi:small subunit ribosomal protein S2
MPYVNQRWLGGTLTNWRTIRRRIDQLLELESQQARGEFQRLTKKEALAKQTLINKLQRRLGGLRNVTQLPKLVFITDTQREDLAVKEANKLHIPIVAMVDSNCDPDPIDLVIPSNDDAIRAIRLIVGTIANAAIEGQQMRATLEAEAAAEQAARESRESRSEADDEQYLAPGLLARVRSGEFSDQEKAKAAAAEASAGDEATSAVEEEEPQEPSGEAKDDSAEQADKDE